MAKELVDALVPIFAGLLRGVSARRRGMMTIPGGFLGIVCGKSFNTIPEVASSELIATYGLAIVPLPLWIVLLSRFM